MPAKQLPTTTRVYVRSTRTLDLMMLFGHRGTVIGHPDASSTRVLMDPRRKYIHSLKGVQIVTEEVTLPNSAIAPLPDIEHGTRARIRITRDVGFKGGAKLKRGEEYDATFSYRADDAGGPSWSVADPTWNHPDPSDPRVFLAVPYERARPV
jgi:hypothetical protein